MWGRIYTCEIVDDMSFFLSQVVHMSSSNSSLDEFTHVKLSATVAKARIDKLTFAKQTVETNLQASKIVQCKIVCNCIYVIAHIDKLTLAKQTGETNLQASKIVKAILHVYNCLQTTVDLFVQ